MINKIIDAIINLLGPYVPITYQEIKFAPDGSQVTYDVIAGGFAGINYPWIVSAIVFLGMLYLTYKILYLFIPKIHRF